MNGRAATHAITARASALIAVLKPRSISGYVAVRSECDPRPILERARANGIIVALPAVIDGKTIVFRTYAEGEALVPAGFGTVAPPPTRPSSNPRCWLVPLVGFDRVGHRLGYGRGHYDRAIAAARADGRRAALVGLAFATQQVERVPVRAPRHSARLDRDGKGNPRTAERADLMRLLFLGDVVGRSGRHALTERLPALVEKHKLDFVIVNGENAAGGFGITEEIFRNIVDAGADVVTTGNHVFDQREALVFSERQERFLRPVNYPPGAPGRGSGLFVARNGARFLVINVMGRVFMDAMDDPFAAIEREVAACPLGEQADAIVIDMHAEASSEKQAMAHYVDGPRDPGRRHAYPRAHVRLPGAARRHRLPDRCRHVRRLRFGDRHETRRSR